MNADGLIHERLVGKRIMAAAKDGQYLQIMLDDGHTLRIGWQDENGDLIKGEPKLCAVDVKITLPGVSIAGAAAAL